MDNNFPSQICKLPAFEGPFKAFQLTANDCNVLFASYPAGTMIASHTHHTDNIGIITKGELILTLDGETNRYSIGDWYHVPAQAEHSARFDQETAEIEFWFSV